MARKGLEHRKSMEIDEPGAKSAECLNGGKDRAEEVEKQ